MASLRKLFEEYNRGGGEQGEEKERQRHSYRRSLLECQEESSQQCQPGDISEGPMVLQVFQTISDTLMTTVRTPLFGALALRTETQGGWRSSCPRSVITLRILFSVGLSCHLHTLAPCMKGPHQQGRREARRFLLGLEAKMSRLE